MTDLAESLVEHGVEVTVLAGRGRYNGGEKFAPSELYKGVRIERAWATGFGKGNVIKRLSDYLSFYFGATWKLLSLPRHDLVMVLTTPPLIGLIALFVCRLRDMRVVSLMQDIYPDVAVALGALPRRNPATRILNYLSCLMLRKSDRIIVLGECMRERVLFKVGERFSPRIDVIHNWADGAKIKPLAEGENSFSLQQNLKGKFVLLFSGNLGRVNEFSTVLEASLILRDRADILFLFIGEGAKAGEIEKFAEKNHLGNIRMLPYQPREVLRQSLAAGHAALVTLADGLAGLSVPSKTYGILAAGRPVLFIGDPQSCIARIITDNNCGEVVSSGDSHRLAQIISDWSIDRSKLNELNLNARKTFEVHFDRRNAVNAYLEAFARCIENSHSPRRTRASKLEETSL
jgi:colanic acid biosynthesis glycosyl transferase WcaI